jgi:hypothetical protein
MAPLNLSAQEMDSDGTMTGSDGTATQQCRRPYDLLSKFVDYFTDGYSLIVLI